MGCLACSAAGVRAQNLPKPSAPVADHANVIAPRLEQQLNRFLLQLEQKTTAQLWIVTVQTTDSVPIEEYSLSLAENWRGKEKGIGQKGKDNGALVLVAVADRAYRIEVGYGLEGALPDAYVDRLARAYFVPNFRQARYGEGLYAAALDMAGAIAREYGVEIGGMPRYDQAQRTRTHANERTREVRGGACATALVILVLVALLSSRRRRRGYGGWAWPILWTLAASGRRSRRRSSWGWSGGFGGGGFGGLGGGGFGGGFGGGGGRFGGGGASGRW